MIMNRSGKRFQFLVRWFLPIGIVFFISLPNPVLAENPGTNTFHGRILYHGAIPPLEERIIKQDAEVCGKTRQIIPVTISQNGGLQQVVVSVEGIRDGIFHVMKAPLIVRNDKCRFFPNLGTATVKQPLEIQNLDSILHNTHIRTKTRAFINVVLLPQSKGIRKVIKKPGPMTITCNKHPFMKGFIHVFDHPYYAVTDSQGAFTIQNLPSGTHTLSLWHETLGTSTHTVTLPQKDRTILDIDFPVP